MDDAVAVALEISARRRSWLAMEAATTAPPIGRIGRQPLFVQEIRERRQGIPASLKATNCAAIPI
jgi:hypothetical protein